MQQRVVSHLNHALILRLGLPSLNRIGVRREYLSNQGSRH